MNHLTIFDELYPTFKITKPIRLIEFFGGYGSQALALKYLGVNFEHWKLCEWAIKSIQAYKDIHIEDDTDYSKNLSKEELQEYLFNKGVSSNYNEPMTREQINRLNEKQVRTIYNNIIATHNLVNIQQVNGEDLEITNKDKYDYILTYSFPCQDISGAGKGKGFSDTTTRSGMLWEVERILKELKETDSLPQVLLMENVPLIHSTENTPDFNKWQLELSKLGYKNYWEDLIATDYGIPQTRNRCFMVSILGDYNYSFPRPIKLEKKLKDMLEDNADEKYYLSDAMIKCFTRETEDDKFPRGDRFKQALKLTNEKDLVGTITTAAGNRATDNFILTKDTENYIEWEDGKNIQMNCRAWKDDKVVATLNTGGETKILTNKSLQKTLEQNYVDDTCYIDTYNKRIDKEKSGTITTGVSFRNNTFLAIKNNTKKGYLEATDGDGIDISGRMEHHRGTVQKQKSQTINTMGGEDVGVVDKDLRIRKLTPKECFRLMGVKDEDFEKCAKNQSDSSLYHLAGDSIVVDVIVAIIKQLL